MGSIDVESRLVGVAVLMRRDLQIVLAFMALWLASTGSLFLYANEISRNGRAVERDATALRVAQLRSCHRLNVLRAAENRSHLRDYQVYLAVMAIPGLPLQVAERILVDAKGKEWAALTHCYPAVDEPLAYAPPEPVAFSVSLPPPEALVVGNGE